MAKHQGRVATTGSTSRGGSRPNIPDMLDLFLDVAAQKGNICEPTAYHTNRKGSLPQEHAHTIVFWVEPNVEQSGTHLAGGSSLPQSNAAARRPNSSSSAAALKPASAPLA
jgi:hypothetical protein